MSQKEFNIALIWAQDMNGVIGANNQIPWKLPQDMAHFKQLTQGHPVIMGRKTWDSLPNRFRPLPNRRNIVLSRRSPDKDFLGHVTHCYNLEEAQALLSPREKVFVIGGGEIYKLFMDQADQIVRTHVQKEFAGDAFAPGIDLAKWKLDSTAPIQHHVDEQSGIAFDIETFKRRR